MPKESKRVVKQAVMDHYTSLHPKYNYVQTNTLSHFFTTLFQPPMTFTKLATYIIWFVTLSGGVYASVEPDMVAQVMAQVKADMKQIVQPRTNNADLDAHLNNKNEFDIDDRSHIWDDDDRTQISLDAIINSEASHSDGNDDNDSNIYDDDDSEDDKSIKMKLEIGNSGDVRDDDHLNDDSRDDDSNDDKSRIVMSWGINVQINDNSKDDQSDDDSTDDSDDDSDVRIRTDLNLDLESEDIKDNEDSNNDSK